MSSPAVIVGVCSLVPHLAMGFTAYYLMEVRSVNTAQGDVCEGGVTVLPAQLTRSEDKALMQRLS